MKTTLLVLLFLSLSKPLLAQPIVLTELSPGTTIEASSQSVDVYGTKDSNDVTMKTGAKAELFNFSGENTITFKSESSNFVVLRSGASVSFLGDFQGFFYITTLKIPATIQSQTINFTDKSGVLKIESGQVMLNDQEVTTSPQTVSFTEGTVSDENSLPYKPDLIIESITIPSSAVAGENINVVVKVKNQGNEDATSFLTGYYLSTNSTISTQDTYITSCNHTVGAGAEETRECNFDITIPLDINPDTYYFGAIADYSDKIDESNEDNNSKAATNRIIIVNTDSKSKAKVDFNNDGFADIFLRNTFTGELTAWLTNGNQVIQKISYDPVPLNSGSIPLTIKDFDDDGHTDILWYNINTGDIYAWLLNGSDKSTANYGTESSSSGKSIININDFNGDNQADLLWYDINTGEIYAWLLDGNGTQGIITYGTESSSSGKSIINVNDFNGDNQADLLWYDINTENIYAWLLDTTGEHTDKFIKKIPMTSGEYIVGFDDFNGDGIHDLLWANSFNSQVTAWLFDDSGSFLEKDFGHTPLNSVWQLNIPGKRNRSSMAGAKVDFNGDGMADIFQYNSFTGELNAWFTDGTEVFKDISYGQVSPDTNWVPISFGDFNADTRTDLLWYNKESGSIIAWLINGGSVVQDVYYGDVHPSSGWAISAINDFNADGCTDLLWYNATDGQVVAWLLNQNGVISKHFFGTSHPQSGWTLKGIDDFNGDFYPDLLWHNAYTGELRVWFLPGTQYFWYKTYGAVLPSSGWALMGLGDFNGDSCADLLWYNTFNGNVFAQLLNAYGTIYQPHYGTVLPDSGWGLVSIDDFNGDYKSDLLWYNRYSGEVLTWTIDGNFNLGFSSYGTVSPNSGWIMAGLDDFNGDGRSDLIWQNIYSNQTRSWLMFGRGIFLEYGFNDIETGSVWQFLIPN